MLPPPAVVTTASGSEDREQRLSGPSSRSRESSAAASSSQATQAQAINEDDIEDKNDVDDAIVTSAIISVDDVEDNNDVDKDNVAVSEANNANEAGSDADNGDGNSDADPTLSPSPASDKGPQLTPPGQARVTLPRIQISPEAATMTSGSEDGERRLSGGGPSLNPSRSECSGDSDNLFSLMTPYGPAMVTLPRTQTSPEAAAITTSGTEDGEQRLSCPSSSSLSADLSRESSAAASTLPMTQSHVINKDVQRDMLAEVLAVSEVNISEEDAMVMSAIISVDDIEDSNDVTLPGSEEGEPRLSGPSSLSAGLIRESSTTATSSQATQAINEELRRPETRLERFVSKSSEGSECSEGSDQSGRSPASAVASRLHSSATASSRAKTSDKSSSGSGSGSGNTSPQEKTTSMLKNTLRKMTRFSIGGGTRRKDSGEDGNFAKPAPPPDTADPKSRSRAPFLGKSRVPKSQSPAPGASVNRSKSFKEPGGGSGVPRPGGGAGAGMARNNVYTSSLRRTKIKHQNQDSEDASGRPTSKNKNHNLSSLYYNFHFTMIILSPAPNVGTAAPWPTVLRRENSIVVKKCKRLDKYKGYLVFSPPVPLLYLPHV